jgi:alanine-synthesizing transaminase
MMFFSRRTSWTTEPNPLSRLIAMARHEDARFCDLTVSNPTRCGFQYLSREILSPFAEAGNLQYDPDPYGLTQAREAVSGYYASKGITIPTSRIFITAGTSEAYSFIFRLIFEPGDALLAPQPSYPLLDYLAVLNDVRLERYRLEPSRNWEINLKGHYELKDMEAKALLVVNPNNPTGNFVHAPELAEINLFCKKRGMAVIADEVFLDYQMETGAAAPVSCALNRHNLAFTLSGVSKILGLPQMKLSWIVVSGPEPIAEEASKRLEVISDTFLSASTPAQRALPQWFSLQPVIQKEILERLRKNAQFLKQKFGGGGPVRLFPVQGGWHAVLQLPSEQSDEDWACLLMKKDQVLTHPGYLFDFQDGSYIVVSLLVPEKDFQEGVEKIAKRVSAPA